MSQKSIFLSHIHEEQEIALYIKQAIEDEFGGFVDVFVSSDGTSIPAGTNFLQKIENGLINCVGAIYLISPKSVNKNWINFELGAIWIRNAINVRNGDIEIPTLPICHSGMDPSRLPMPLCSLNAVRANEPAGLSFALKSLQAAVGGRGSLKTDINALIGKISIFENNYTKNYNIIKALKLMGLNENDIERIRSEVKLASSLPNKPQNFCFQSIIVDQHLSDDLIFLSKNELNGILFLDLKGVAMAFVGNRPRNGPEFEIKFAFSAFAEAISQKK
ncbi:toll/interleukin-1 receptor domain-containing protein [Acetobacter tropicalis]|uniref:toll/interleukin-1 receptor domain-containing protein n=1 Tax=Acetobacter tropicalis TaxID=104102 RepID=UPI000559657F|nr:toll/interleukin-1 receptor domain-containing protein [Acetobacter tropicalis]KAA8383943.1 toll/interleukin-1 receptor domain-containing protein [Acetobacter tropicalis]KAA8392273.1 toll/interleukin-1 receptor domain-containing protein [Acetobacter tropicalis]MBC9010240.1 toll/interleukin-1 receptor domain-containing protein [Acetobacter tropicalis]MDO8170985.1 toll/interleukin-1 receptor domain-containing protein [Acetobacter tropicalis]